MSCPRSATAPSGHCRHLLLQPEHAKHKTRLTLRSQRAVTSGGLDPLTAASVRLRSRHSDATRRVQRTSSFPTASQQVRRLCFDRCCPHRGLRPWRRRWCYSYCLPRWCCTCIPAQATRWPGLSTNLGKPRGHFRSAAPPSTLAALNPSRRPRDLAESPCQIGDSASVRKSGSKALCPVLRPSERSTANTCS
jgi:hypothetical protein